MVTRSLYIGCAVLFFSTILFSKESPDIFVGPFSNWINVKNAPYNAVGNGIADDGPALQAALTALSTSSNPLYLPAGTYRTTSTLQIQNCRGKRIVGAHPDSVTIKWDGAQNGEILVFSGVGDTRFGRITIDGANKAGIGIVVTIRNRTSASFFPSNWEFHDMHMLNMTLALKGGEGDNNPEAEVTYIRCLFKNCGTAFSSPDYNTGDVWFHFCTFEDCGTGIKGLSEGSVTHSIFRRSKIIDILDEYYVAARHCFSTGSKSFFASTDGIDGRPGILDGNTIIDPTNTVSPIALSGAGPFVVFDNVVRSAANASAPVISRGVNQQGNFFIGNTFTTGTAATAIQTPAGTNGRVVDNLIVDRSAISATEPELPSTPSRFTGNVYEPSAMTGAAIQAAIVSAATTNPHTLSVVRLRPGTYSVSSSIIIPKNIPLWIMGDGFGWNGSTQILWTGSGSGPVFKLTGPSKATISDLFINGGTGKAQIVEINNADQQGGRIFMTRILAAEGVTGIACLVDRLDWTRVEGWDMYPSSQDPGMVSTYKVIGGPLTAADQATTACVNIWNAGGLMCEGGQGKPFFDIVNNGRFMATDFWGESGARRQSMLELTNASSGTITLQGYKLQAHTSATGTTPNFLFNGFSGKATVLGLSLSNAVVSITGNNAAQNVLWAADFFGPQNMDGSTATVTSTQGQAAIINCLQGWPSDVPQSMYHYYTYTHPYGNPTDDWLRDMMQQARSNHPIMDLDSTPAGATDVKLMRLVTTQSFNPTHIVKCDTCPYIVSVVPHFGERQNRTHRLTSTRIVPLAGGGPDFKVPQNATRIMVYDMCGRLLYMHKTEQPGDAAHIHKEVSRVAGNKMALIRMDTGDWSGF